jgi:hypothetical protein
MQLFTFIKKERTREKKGKREEKKNYAGQHNNQMQIFPQKSKKGERRLKGFGKKEKTKKETLQCSA